MPYERKGQEGKKNPATDVIRMIQRFIFNMIRHSDGQLPYWRVWGGSPDIDGLKNTK
jgi:hypothetical protein